MRKLVVILDPAHGADIPGKCAPDMSHREYKWSRERVSQLLPMLQKEKFTVHISNPTENEIGLSKRVKATNAFSGEKKFFLSLHNNAAGNGQWMNARGFSVYTTKGQTKSDHYAEILFQELKKTFIGIEGFKERKDLSDGDSDNEANFTVLMCNCPAVMIEWLFQDNKDDLVLIKDKAINERLCQAIVTAIIKIDEIA